MIPRRTFHNPTAQLHAAAGDLLDALSFALPFAESAWSEVLMSPEAIKKFSADPEFIRIKTGIEKARAAIAKAKGAETLLPDRIALADAIRLDDPEVLARLVSEGRLTRDRLTEKGRAAVEAVRAARAKEDQP